MYYLFLLLVLSGCFMHRVVTGQHWDSSIVRSGILKVNINKQAFLDVWGELTRASTEASDSVMSASWSGFGGSFYSGEKTIEIWSYDKIGIQLAFYEDQLVGWKTDKTVAELKAAAIH